LEAVIEAITELFVERVPIALPRPQITAATRLLLVDACGRPRRITDLAREIERCAPAATTLVEFEELAGVLIEPSFDAVWLFVDSDSDIDYCRLVTQELRETHVAERVSAVAVDAAEGMECAATIDAACVGSAPPWRRRREASRGAAELVDRLFRAGVS
jgi:hypothetical protein